jgi:site-specific DNA-methyltransferase (adenine-specific)
MLLKGDCRQQLATLPDNSVHAIITDPPYELGFMGKTWDSTGIAYNLEVWTQCLRVLKPGGHLLAFGGSRTYHRLACAIEDAGFEIRDQIMWVYGSGFPKSLDVSKAIDKAAGAKREVIGTSRGVSVSTEDNQHGGINRGAVGIKQTAIDVPITAPSTDEAKQWDGWGTALKPAHEPIVLARKPLNGTVANNVLTHGVGALNIDESRITSTDNFDGLKGRPIQKLATRRHGETEEEYDLRIHESPSQQQALEKLKTLGRWPANFIHDGSDEVLELFPDTKSTGNGTSQGSRRGGGNGPSVGLAGTKYAADGYADGGSAARFFYCAKASRTERNTGLDHLPNRQGGCLDGNADTENARKIGQHPEIPVAPVKNFHPTVKPLALIHYLIKLVTPPGGTILDPFLGSGTTAVAATQLGHPWIGCELTEDYWPIIEARIAHATQLT